jgi:hypothetical protein
MAEMPWDELVKKAEEKGYGEVAPVGRHVVRVETATAKVSKNSNPMIACKLKITQGPHAGKLATSRNHNLTMSEKAASMFLQNLKALGISKETLLSQKPTMAQIAKAIEGASAIANTWVDTNPTWGKDQEGNDVISVKWSLSPLDGGGTRPITTFPKLASENGSAPATPGAPSTPSVPSAPAVPVAQNPGF